MRDQQSVSWLQKTIPPSHCYRWGWVNDYKRSSSTMRRWAEWPLPTSGGSLGFPVVNADVMKSWPLLVFPFIPMALVFDLLDWLEKWQILEVVCWTLVQLCEKQLFFSRNWESLPKVSIKYNIKSKWGKYLRVKIWIPNYISME